ncbi:hypothetical protein HYQ44_002357 [Verticillium longisporum]|nr:hypothetical protein HYQ44_002357 [Verticillium longisporum]
MKCEAFVVSVSLKPYCAVSANLRCRGTMLVLHRKFFSLATTPEVWHQSFTSIDWLPRRINVRPHTHRRRPTCFKWA